MSTPATPIDPTIANLRRDYRVASLDEAHVGSEPFALFRRWFDEAVAAEIPEPNGMTVASVDAQGRPAARILLLKGVDPRGFTFYTNYASRKGREFEACPYGALVFWWAELERQVRIEGVVEQVDAAESDAYFASRPLGSRLGAWASTQSSVIAGRQVLEDRERAALEQFGDSPPRPPHWGGYRLIPNAMEFWQGRPSRLHDRLRFTAVQASDSGPSIWQLERLAP